MSGDEELMLDAFRLLYQVYREQKAGRKYYRPMSIYPVLSRIQRRLDEPVRREGLSIAGMRERANSPWT
jgi:hypothetical protein